MSVKIVDLTPTLINQSKSQTSLGIRLMLEDIARLSFPITPKKEGNLRSNVLKQVLGQTGTIVWLKEYAVFQEEKQYRNYTTAGTGPHFAEKSVMRVVGNATKYWQQSRLI